MFRRSLAVAADLVGQRHGRWSQVGPYWVRREEGEDTRHESGRGTGREIR
jgi:hypothetical protein